MRRVVVHVTPIASRGVRAVVIIYITNTLEQYVSYIEFYKFHQKRHCDSLVSKGEFPAFSGSSRPEMQTKPQMGEDFQAQT